MNLANSLLKIWGLEPKDLRHPNARPVEKYDEIQPGDHVAVVRRDSTVWHHAIYCGNNEWIEFNGPDKELATIAKIDTRYFFSKDDDIVVIDYPDGSYSSAETIALATKLLDSTTEYNALLSNCECVATFCRCGRYVKFSNYPPVHTYQRPKTFK